MSQPDEMYPNNPVTVTRQQPINSTHNDGSFGPVFIVLAVIVVLSAVACVLGRLCSRRHHRVKEAHHHPKPSKQNQSLGPTEWESRQKPSFNMRDHHEDIEFGFDNRNPSGKVVNNGGGKIKPVDRYNGGYRPEVRFADNV